MDNLEPQDENNLLIAQIRRYAEIYGCMPFIDDVFLKGGYRVVKTEQDRNSIPCEFRKVGMVVVVVGEDFSFKEYRLVSEKCRDNIWVLISSNNIPGTVATDNDIALTDSYEEIDSDATTQRQLNLFLREFIQSQEQLLNGLYNIVPSEDNMFYLEDTDSPNEKKIYGNVSTYIENFYNKNNFILTFIPTQIIGIYINGLRLCKEEYSIDTATNKVTLDIPTYQGEIEVVYNRFIKTN